MRKFAAVVLVLVLAAAAWSAAWLYLSRQAGARVDAWIATEAAQGRTWTCPNRRIGGYPVAIAIACGDPTYAGEALGRAVQASLGHLEAEVSILHPRSLALRLAAPFAYRTSDGQTAVTARWTRLHLDLAGLPDPRTATLEGTDVTVGGLFGQAGRQDGRAARLDTRFVLVDAPGDPTIAFHVVVDGAPVPALDALLGGDAPLALDLSGRLDRADIGDAKTPEDAMERWRREGGRIDLGPSSATRGASTVSATGTLGLDPLHRPQGRLSAQFVGLEPILRRFGISGNLAAAGSLLNSLFGRASDQPTIPGALALPIGAKDGRLSIGPIRTAVTLPALY